MSEVAAPAKRAPKIGAAEGPEPRAGEIRAVGPADPEDRPAPMAEADLNDRQSRLARIDRVASLMDSKFTMPVLGVRFGLDSILGLIPGVGDAATLLPSAWLIYEGHKLGARKRTLARMAMNVGADTLIGAIPLVGDVFDLFFKSNRRNADLLLAELRGADDPHRKRKADQIAA